MTQYNGMVPAIAGSGLDGFIRAANAAPYLTLEQEQDLGRRWQAEQDLDAAQQLVISHLRYVIHVARKYSGYGLPLADLIQEGSSGLMKAVKRFDPSRGVRLVSFATHWIRAEIHEYVIRNWNIVKIATTKAQRKLFFNLRSHKERLGWFTQSEVKRVAEELSVPESQVLEMEARLSEHNLSFDGHEGDDNEFPSTPAQWLADERAEPAALLENEDWEASQHNQLSEALESLDPRSRHIIEARWLSDEKAGLKELGEQYEVSAERIRQIEQQALKRLRSGFDREETRD
ncbi:MAG: RNA polymerase sigma factor RpoH [Gammaproteobacteria bacterium]|nr:RNA polymerase sigma factor RpoH [Gammaproteobacteria bacterium]